MSKSLSESAAEILATSLGSAKKDAMPVGPGAGAPDLGGETPTSDEKEGMASKAVAPVKEAPKPGQAGAPSEPVVDPSKKKKEVNDVGTVTPRPGTTIASQGTTANEETDEDEDLPELTEEEIDAYLDSLTEEELEELAALSEQSDEDEESSVVVEAKDDDEDDEDDEDEDEDEDDEDEDEDDDKKKKNPFAKKDEAVESEEPVLTEEEVAAARAAALKELVAENMGSCAQDIDALFSGENLSEEFKTKATTIFEAAVRARVESIVKTIAEENEGIMESTVAEVEATLTEQVDEYLNYVVEQWMEENKLAVESGLRSEIAEDFMAGLKNLFVEHYIEVPEEKTDLLEELVARCAKFEENLSEQVVENAKLIKALNESKAQEILRKTCDGLTEMQIEKIKALAEGVEFTTEGEYSQKLSVIRENYFPSGKKVSEAPVTLVETDAKEVSSVMDRYVNAITKTAAK